MVNFYYFTDTDQLIGQSINEAFGEVSSSDSVYDASKDKYRFTSLHRATNNPLAYASCKGQILVQQNADNPALVNIVLKPLEQPNNGLPVVAYFIYRGILKSSLTDGTNVVDGGNTLTYNILENNSVTPQKVLGIELVGTGYADQDLLDNAFYLPKSDFELWTVFGGWSIGSFDKNGFGFEIIFERIGYESNLGIARHTQNVFEIPKLALPASQADVFDFKTKKEIVNTYIDPCAFYGNFFDDKIKARRSTDDTDDEFVHDFSKKSGDEIYRDLIDGGTTSLPKNIFYNRNAVYLDIRNDWNFSFNYFDNYSNELRLSYIDDSNEPIDEVNYYRSGWPILKLTDLPGGDNKSTVRISFPTKDDMQPFVCVINGERKIKLIEKIKQGKSDFFNLQPSLTELYTSDSLYLVSPTYDGSDVISQYIRLKYIDQVFTDPSPVNDYSPVKHESLDFVFQPTTFLQPFNTNDSIKINVYEEDRYINLLSDFGKDYTSKIGMAKDIGNTALFWSVSKRKTKSRFAAESPSFSITKLTDPTDYFTLFIDSKSGPGLSGKNIVPPSSLPVQLLNETKTRFSFFKRRNSIDFDTDFFSVVLSNADFATIVSVANTNFTSIYKPYLCFSNKAESTYGGTPYVKFDMVLKGLKRNASNVMEMAEFPTGLSIYSYTPSELK